MAVTSWWPGRQSPGGGNAQERNERDALVPRSTRPPAPSGASDGRLVDAAGFALDAGATREQCWAQLPAAVQQRLTEIAGPTLAWTAVMVSPRAGGAARPQAAVFGHRGFAAADPTVQATGAGDRPVYALAAYGFDTDALLQARVVHQPGPALPAPGADVGLGAEPAGAPRADLSEVRGLDAATTEVITSMPPRAQELLVAPIAAHGEPVLRSHRFWQGTGPHVLDVVVVLASARRVTAIAGQRTIPDGGDATTAGWVLDAWHSEVRARRGL